MSKFSNNIDLWFRQGAGLRRAVVVFALSVAIALGVAVARGHIGVREFLIFLIGIVALTAVLMPSDTILRIGLGAGIASFGLGWRTVSLSTDLILAPFEVIIWALAAILIVRSVVRREPLRFEWSLPFMLFVFLTIPAFFGALASGVEWDKVVGYGKNILMVVPFFLVIRNLVPEIATWRRLVWIATGVCVYLASVGIVVYFFPTQASPLSNLLGAVTTESINFRRAGFPGWGPLAAWLFVLVIGLLVGFLNAAQTWRARGMLLAVISILGLATLISGQRGAWLALLFGTAVFAVFSPRLGILMMAIASVLVWLTPEESVWIRFASAFDSRLYDPSAADRYQRAIDALALIQTNPLGVGFGIKTWVHSDYLEIGAAMGIPALILLAGAMGVTGWRLLRIQLKPTEYTVRRLGQGALAMFVILLVELSSAGYVTLSFMTVIAWFFWAMADQYVIIARSSRSHEPTTSLDSAPHL